MADGHQPCHAGSLYASVIFPEGDRGADSLRMGRGNMHSTWDNLLGGSASVGDVRRRVAELQDDKEALLSIETDIKAAESVEKWIAASAWLAESRAEAKRSVYTPEVLEPVTVAMRGLTDSVELPPLSDAYYQNAGKIARLRAIQAGYRLSEIVSLALTPGI
jgi:S1/P1 Nuclease